MLNSLEVKNRQVVHFQFSSVRSLSHVSLYDPINRSMPGLLVHRQLSESTQTHVHWVSDAIQPSDPLSSPSPPALNFSQHQVFSNESTLRISWPKYWSCSFKIRPSNEHPGLISFRMDWLDLFAVQGTLKSLLQHHSSKASILWRSAFFIVQPSHPYMTTGSWGHKESDMTEWLNWTDTYNILIVTIFYAIQYILVTYFIHSSL